MPKIPMMMLPLLALSIVHVCGSELPMTHKLEARALREKRAPDFQKYAPSRPPGRITMDRVMEDTNVAEGSGAFMDPYIFYSCKDEQIDFSWTAHIDAGDIIRSIKWYHTNKARVRRLLAMSSDGIFTPVGEPPNRLFLSDTNAGIQLDSVDASKEGYYTVEVIVTTALGDNEDWSGSVYVYVADSLQTEDGQLHLTLKPEAEYDETNDVSYLVLNCGTFNYPTHPEFDVAWLTPSIEGFHGSVYKDGNFQLKLEAAEEGIYSCRVPSIPACVGDNPVQADITLSRMSIRVIDLDGRIKKLQHSNKILKANNTRMEQEHGDLISKTDEVQTQLNQTSEKVLKTRTEVLKSQRENQTSTSDIRGTLSHLGQTDDYMQSQINGTRTETEYFLQMSLPYVAFNARQNNDQQVSQNHPRLQFTNVLYNAGDGYDPSTGYFTAPVSGLYAFFFQAVTKDAVTLMASFREIGRTFPLDAISPISCKGPVDLSVGDKVWVQVRPQTGTARFKKWASFMGYLLSVDPVARSCSSFMLT